MSASIQHIERRRFSRVPFDAAVRLKHPSGNWSGKLIDISLKGILITRPPGWKPDGNQGFLVEVNPPDSPFNIRMEMTLANERDELIAFECQHIDLDSISHLRRLVELNIGDESILQRELGELGTHNDK